MLKRTVLGLACTLFLAWVVYVIWANKDRNMGLPPADVQFRSFTEVGRDSGRGNLVGIQPYMLPVDYSSEEAFFQKLNGYFSEARKKGWLKAKSIVVLPEYLGTWLVVAGEKKEVYATPHLTEAVKMLAYSNFFTYMSSVMQAPKEIGDRTSYAIMTMKAGDMANIYQQTFSRLAGNYDVTIVAGSIVLPEPTVKERKLALDGGPLYSVSGVFTPDGSLSGLVRKSFLSPREQLFIVPGKADNNPVIHTPAGKLAVLINQDSWFPQSYKNIRKQQANLIAVPAYLKYKNQLGVTWDGYEGHPTPADAVADVNKITEKEAWDKFSFGTRGPAEAEVKKGIAVFLRGDLWDLGTDGSTLMLSDSLSYGKRNEGAGLSCIWL